MITAGLQFLNARVPHRCSAVYRLDKQGEVVPEFLQAVPLQDSFCQFVLRDGLFRTEEAAQDARLNGHKYQSAIGSYHGLPLVGNFGELFGTICHFDTEPLTMADQEFDLFRQAAKILPRYLNKAPSRLG